MARRVLTVALLSVVLIGGAMAAAKFVSYAHLYRGTEFNPESLASPRPTYYYLDWRNDIPDRESLQALVDTDGVFSFGDRAEYAGRTRRDPLHVIQACLGLHDQLLDSADAERDEREAILRRQLDWLLGEAVEVLPHDIPVWPQRLRFDRYGLDDPWISALTQGQAISLLVRMATHTGDSTYADWARRATRAFTQPGLPIVWRGNSGEIFFEEYPCEPPSHVLNGCLFAWLGLWDFVRYSGDPDLGSFCLASLDQIRRRVPAYELGDWTRYDVSRQRPTSPAYQEIHAALAEAIAAATEDAFWRERATRWRTAAEDPLARSRVFFAVLAGKVGERLTVGGRLTAGEPVRGLGLADIRRRDPTGDP